MSLSSQERYYLPKQFYKPAHSQLIWWRSPDQLSLLGYHVLQYREVIDPEKYVLICKMVLNVICYSNMMMWIECNNSSTLMITTNLCKPQRNNCTWYILLHGNFFFLLKKKIRKQIVHHALTCCPCLPRKL